MTTRPSRPGHERQWIVYAVLCLVAFVLAVIALPSSAAYYRRFLGDPNPLWVLVVASLVGGACLFALQSLGGFEVLRRDRIARGIVTAAGFATVFAGLIVVADLLLRYPVDLNVPLPAAFAFYPSIGLIAEVAFHLAPLTVVLVLLLPLKRRIRPSRRVWAAIVIVAVVEPVFQVLLGGGALTGLDAYTAVHVFAFAVAQFYVFRRYDFVSMFAFRLVYYLYWHIAWGWLRLDLLF